MKRNLLLGLCVLFAIMLISRQISWAQGPIAATQSADATPTLLPPPPPGTLLPPDATHPTPVLLVTPFDVPMLITPSGRPLLAQNETDIRKLLVNAPDHLGSFQLKAYPKQRADLIAYMDVINTDGTGYGLQIDFTPSEEAAHSAFSRMVSFLTLPELVAIGDEALIAWQDPGTLAVMRYRNLLVFVETVPGYRPGYRPSTGQNDPGQLAITRNDLIGLLTDLANYLAQE